MRLGKRLKLLSSEQLATKGDITKIEAKFDKELAIIKWMLGLVIFAVAIPILREYFYVVVFI